MNQSLINAAPLAFMTISLEGYHMLHNGFHNGFHGISTRQCASWDSWGQGIPPKYRIRFSWKIVSLNSARAQKNRQLFAYTGKKVSAQTRYRHACEQKKKLILRVARAWRN